MLDQIAEENKINIENAPLKRIEDLRGMQRVLLAWVE